MTADDKTMQADKHPGAAQLSALYRQRPQVTSPAALDQRILDLAAAQVPPAKSHPWSSQWLGVASMACVLCLTLLIVIRSPMPEVTNSLPPAYTPERQTPASFDQREALDSAKPMPRALRKQAPKAMTTPAAEAGAVEADAMEAELFEAIAPAAAPAPTRTLPMAMEEKTRATAASEPVPVRDLQRQKSIQKESFVQRRRSATDTAASGSPDALLRDIEALLEQGDLDLAREALRRFQKSYPNHPLDPELLERLAETK